MKALGGVLMLIAATAAARDLDIIGYNDMRECLTAVNQIYRGKHPDISIRMILEGTRTAPAALADGRSMLAPMGAEFSDQELADFRKITGTAPIEVRIAHDSLNPAALSAPLAIFVHRDNPLSRLSIAEAAKIFAPIKPDQQVTDWASFGLPSAPIHPVGVKASAALGLFLSKHAFQGRPLIATLAGYPQSADVVREVGRDLHAIGFAAANRSTPEVKILALAEQQGGPYLGPSDRHYPLDRTLYLYARRPLDPMVRDYLDLVLSAEGQALIAQGSLGYRPLDPDELALERAKLQQEDP
jgi:phosphate transport system substrate-binding protein